jgi:hypothetical protein
MRPLPQPDIIRPPPKFHELRDNLLVRQDVANCRGSSITGQASLTRLEASRRRRDAEALLSAGRRRQTLGKPQTEHFDAQWRTLMGTEDRRSRRRRNGLGTWRLVRYADDFVVLVNGTRAHAEALHEQIAQVLAPMGLRLSPAKTQVVHLSQGVDFLGFHLQWRREKGTRDRWYVYTFIADRPVRQLKDKIRVLAAPLELEGPPQPPGPSRRELAADQRGRDHPVRPRQGSGHPATPTAATRSPDLGRRSEQLHPPAGTVESPLR